MNKRNAAIPCALAIVAGAMAATVVAQTTQVPSSLKNTPAANTTPSSVATWSPDELQRIVKADDLKISPFREDGLTYGTPTWIWCVEVDGALYVRAYNGMKSSWYQAAVRNKAGRIIAAGMTREVAFEPVAGAINDRIDGAYRAKYRGSQYLDAMISERSRAATVRVLPRENLKKSS